jgi:molybdate transport system substrate-binding protein
MRGVAIHFIVLVTVLAFGCGQARDTPDNASQQASSERIVLLVAASTKDAVAKAVAEYERTAGVRVSVVPGPTSTLVQQITAGSPAQLLLAASETWTGVLDERGLCEATTPLLSSELVIIVPNENPAGVQTPADLIADRVRRIALAGENVPAGVYAQQALESHQIYQQLMDAGRIVRAGDVRIALGFVERGEAEAGIVYSTDALISKDVEAAYRFDAGDHDPIVYPLVLLKSEAPHANARELYDFLRSAKAAGAFESYGFKLLSAE